MLPDDDEGQAGDKQVGGHAICIMTGGEGA